MLKLQWQQCPEAAPYCPGPVPVYSGQPLQPPEAPHHPRPPECPQGLLPHGHVAHGAESCILERVLRPLDHQTRAWGNQTFDKARYLCP